MILTMIFTEDIISSSCDLSINEVRRDKGVRVARVIPLRTNE